MLEKVKIGDVVKVIWLDAMHEYADHLEEDLMDFGLAKVVDYGEVVAIDRKRILLCNRIFPPKDEKDSRVEYVANFKSLFSIPLGCILAVLQLKDGKSLDWSVK